MKIPTASILHRRQKYHFYLHVCSKALKIKSHSNHFHRDVADTTVATKITSPKPREYIQGKKVVRASAKHTAENKAVSKRVLLAR